jgi:glycogen debranching enzyme
VCADAVIDGLQNFGVIRDIPSLDLGSIAHKHIDPEIKQLFRDQKTAGIDKTDVQFLITAYRKSIEALRKNITPVGFSACSLEDNDTRGTDVNYRSVWGRDGSIAVIGSLPLDDPDIRECQRRTLATLLDHISPTGQIPSNVRIDTCA